MPIREGKTTSWLSLDACRWSAPKCLTRLTSLSLHFPTLKEFFRVTLQVPDASVRDIVQGLCDQAGDMNNLDNLRALLLSLSDWLTNEDLADDRLPKLLLKLQAQKVFPVRRSSGASQLASASDQDWFIPDRDRLTRCFHGKVWLLDFTYSDIKKLVPVFERLSLKDYHLSNAVTEKTEYSGKVKPCPSLTNYIQGKARFISL